VLGSSSQPVTSESASAAYRISGTLSQGGRTWTDTLSQTLQFGNDETDIDPACTTVCYQWAHQETTSSGAETISGPGAAVSRADDASWTIDAPNGYQQNARGTDFFIKTPVQAPRANTIAER
jgi:hypothetical protein